MTGNGKSDETADGEVNGRMNEVGGAGASDRRTARIVGVLFIIGTVSGILGKLVMGSLIESPLDLERLASNQAQVITGAILYFLMAGACACTTIWLYPVLRRHDPALALGAAGFRMVEGIFIAAGTICTLLLLTLAGEFVSAGAPEAAYFKTFAALLHSGNLWAGGVVSALGWGTATLMYNYVFYKTGLAPKWLAAWGILGISLALAGTFLVMYGNLDLSSASYGLLHIPIAVQEMVFAGWLVAKGFGTPKAAREPVAAGAVAS